MKLWQLLLLLGLLGGLGTWFMLRAQIPPRHWHITLWADNTVAGQWDSWGPPTSRWGGYHDFINSATGGQVRVQGVVVAEEK